MDLTYLKNLENYYINNPKISRIGISEQQIEKLEKELSIELPKAYKEFLNLAGDRDNLLGDWNRGFDQLSWIQEEIKESMTDVNLHLKPFFVFAEYSRDQALFFFLNEGENPSVYAYYEERIEENGKEVFYIKFRNSFSEYIDRCINEMLTNK
ncbi:SMI1/KNR4 family protein [Sphingobacterium sp. SRCM116780]|uniref:SMI1/KNR4 family protein n=1 Tax=Sphingobacterium sp. SRCM116780 TaxID=2907623 RepID=UPI001F2F8FC6|nr:SMI1/KNR4 family protein [Sphingobacterium sp. SRCM116780]UIR55063.1 SMI1/KNR4 family protein [Sphingobacterium sp. SRCM116780]